MNFGNRQTWFGLRNEQHTQSGAITPQTIWQHGA
jgi:hypothetical protein